MRCGVAEGLWCGRAAVPSPCHAGHTAGCHRATSAGPPLPPPGLLLFSPAVRIHDTAMTRQALLHRLFRIIIAGVSSCLRAPDGQGARGGERGGGHFGSPSLRGKELQGHGEERQKGAHPRPFRLFDFSDALIKVSFNWRRKGDFSGETQLCPPPRFLEL